MEYQWFHTTKISHEVTWLAINVLVNRAVSWKAN